jgi:hypothetical protein
MSANRRLQLFLRDVGAFFNDFISHHDSRSYRQVHLKIVIRHIIGFRFGYGFDANVVFGTQTGHHFFKMLSWLTIRFVHKESDLYHVSLHSKIDYFRYDYLSWIIRILSHVRCCSPRLVSGLPPFESRIDLLV